MAGVISYSFWEQMWTCCFKQGLYCLQKTVSKFCIYQWAVYLSESPLKLPKPGQACLLVNFFVLCCSYLIKLWIILFLKKTKPKTIKYIKYFEHSLGAMSKESALQVKLFKISVLHLANAIILATLKNYLA